MLLPGFHPVLVGDGVKYRGWKGLNHTEIIKRLFKLMTRIFDMFVHRQVGPDGDRSRRGALIFIINELNTLLGHHAVGRETCQHIGNGFCQFAIDGQ